MKPAKQFAQVSRRFYRPEQTHCPVCQRRLQRAVTLSERTVITLEEVIKLVHAGYRCPDPHCAGAQRTYRSMQADGLALPWFTYGLDIVLLVGRLRLREHQTVDEIHQELLRRLDPLGVKIARREILYLFEAYCTMLRASSSAKDDMEWLAQVEKNGGIIVSVDGIQPEKGNETVYLVRDALTGRVLEALNVTSSETAVIKALLAPVVALGVKVLGTITDAEVRELLAVQELWPDVPHQVCQFHVARRCLQKAFEADKAVKTAMRKRLQPKVREVRKQIKKYLVTASPQEAEQLAVLDDYANGILTALGTRWASALQVRYRRGQPDVGGDRSQPAAALQKGGPVSRLCVQKLARLQNIVAERAAWAEPVAQVKRLHVWLLEVEHLLDASRTSEGEVLNNVTVGTRLDRWRERMSRQLTDGSLSQLEHECLCEFLQVRVLLAVAPGAVLRPQGFSAYQQRHGAQHSRPEARNIVA